MAKEYKVGEKYYLPVTVKSICPGYNYPIELGFIDSNLCDTDDTISIADEPDLLLTAEDIATVINTERDEALEELKARNAELEAENAEWKHNEQAYHEATEKLKAERDDLASQLGKNLAEIQALTSDVHFFKETCAKQSAEYDELKCRYDELDSVNHEQAEKIRRQDKALTDLKKRNDDLQAENTNLTFLLEDKPEKGAARKVHVVTNDGKEYMFRKCTKASFDNYNDFTVLKIYEGDTYVAGFLRGDSPENFAAWWTE